jgi:carbon monoxide dehydrogenase subunit G
MELVNDFVVPVPRAQAWAVLMDVERIAPCMPGATFDGYLEDGFKGRVKVKLGPITVTYNGTARFVEQDEAAGLAVIEAAGKEARGSGTAGATIRAKLDDEGASTRVKVVTDLNVTGKPAQFGRSVMAEVAAKLIGQFASCLADQLGSDEPQEPAAEAPAEPVGVAASAEEPAGEPTGGPVRPTDDAIDLMGTAGVPVLKRALPALVVLVGVFVLWRLLRRSR